MYTSLNRAGFEPRRVARSAPDIALQDPPGNESIVERGGGA